MAISAAIQSAMTGIGSAISDLTSLGAKHFLVMNLPDLGKTPGISSIGSPALDNLASSASHAFNQNLASMHGGISGPDIQLFYVYGALDEVVANPGAYGLTDVIDSCYTGDVDGSSIAGNPVAACADPSQYAFWDYEHPTAALRQTLGNLVYSAIAPAAVPEPSSLALF